MISIIQYCIKSRNFEIRLSDKCRPWASCYSHVLYVTCPMSRALCHMPYVMPASRATGSVGLSSCTRLKLHEPQTHTWRKMVERNNRRKNPHTDTSTLTLTQATPHWHAHAHWQATTNTGDMQTDRHEDRLVRDSCLHRSRENFVVYECSIPVRKSLNAR